MNNPLYLIKDMVFRNDEHKYNGKARATAYCKRHDIDPIEIVTLKNDTELAYYRHLQDKLAKGEIREMATHQSYDVTEAQKNYIGETTLVIACDVPFLYIDNDGLHCELVIEDINEVDTKLIYQKILFDNKFAFMTYLKLLYVDKDGNFVEWKLDDIPVLRKMFTAKYRKASQEKRQQIRDQQTYDRLVQLRDEGRISVSQRKELYRLEKKLK